MRFFRLSLIVASFACAAVADAQPAKAPKVETAADRRKAYVSETEQLANVLGAAHALRLLCADRSDQTWREYMRELLNSETRVRRASLIDEFNAGYREAERRFPACSSDARAEEDELKARGLRLADTLSARNSD
jgi:uncharacterized protein (TIGR02301 family)